MDYNPLISMKVPLDAKVTGGLDIDHPPGSTGLHCTLFTEVVEVVACLAEIEGCSVNQVLVEFTGSTPPFWGAYNQHERVGKILLI